MRVLYKSRKLKYFIILQMVFAALAGFAVKPYPTSAETRMQNADSDWALPLHECRDIVLDGNAQITGLASDNDIEIYLTDTTGSLSSYTLPDLELNWTSSLPTVNQDALLIDSRNLYIVNQSDGKANLRAISKITGITSWQSKTDLSNLHSLKQNADTLFFIGLKTIWAIEKSDGSLKWLKSILSAADSYTTSEKEGLLILTEGLDLLEVSEPDGSYKKIASLQSKPDIVMMDHDGNAFTGDSIGNIKFLGQTGNGRGWSAKAGGRITGLTNSGADLIITSLDNFVYKYNKASGALVWKKRMSERIYAAGSLREGTPLLIGNRGNRIISILDPDDGKFLNQIDLGEQRILGANPILTENFLIVPDGTRLRVFTPNQCVKKDGDESLSNSPPNI